MGNGQNSSNVDDDDGTGELAYPSIVSSLMGAGKFDEAIAYLDQVYDEAIAYVQQEKTREQPEDPHGPLTPFGCQTLDENINTESNGAVETRERIINLEKELKEAHAKHDQHMARVDVLKRELEEDRATCELTKAESLRPGTLPNKGKITSWVCLSNL